jgi:hypothetical protein
MAVRRPGARRPSSHRLPEAEEVWQRVAAYARDCLLNDRPVFTVTRSVENRITDVKDKSIGRASAQGMTNASRVTRAMVESVWSSFKEGRGVHPTFISPRRWSSLLCPKLWKTWMANWSCAMILGVTAR